MTFKEKLIQEHPEKDIGWEIACKCPEDYGYEKSNNVCHEGGCEECWNRKIPEPELKVGDVVRIKDGLVENRQYGGITLFPDMNFLGTGTIKSIRASQNQFYDIGVFTYTREMLEKAEEAEDDMEKLKEKMEVTTLIQNRCGEFGMIFLNPNSKDGKGIYNPQKDGCFDYLCNYECDLTCKEDSMRDIMKIKFPSDAGGNYRLVKDFFESEGELKISSCFKWDWERQEVPVTKDVSLEELNAILKEKFPDIDKFNLPIKE